MVTGHAGGPHGSLLGSCEIAGCGWSLCLSIPFLRTPTPAPDVPQPPSQHHTTGLPPTNELILPSTSH